MLAFIKFNPAMNWWSAFTFWIVVATIVITLGFTLVVLVRGIGDLRFLLKAMDEEREDAPPGNATSGSAPPHP